MRGLIVVVVALAGFAAIYWWAARLDARRMRRLNAPAVVGSSTPLALTPGGKELERSALDMARVLNDALLDPVLRQDADWERRARSVLADYYGDD